MEWWNATVKTGRVVHSDRLRHHCRLYRNDRFGDSTVIPKIQNVREMIDPRRSDRLQKQLQGLCDWICSSPNWSYRLLLHEETNSPRPREGSYTHWPQRVGDPITNKYKQFGTRFLCSAFVGIPSFEKRIKSPSDLECSFDVCWGMFLYIFPRADYIIASTTHHFADTETTAPLHWLTISCYLHLRTGNRNDLIWGMFVRWFIHIQLPPGRE